METRWSFAVGAGLVAVQVKVRVAVAPEVSVPVIVTEYGPPSDALAAKVPVMMPVVELILSPGGSVLLLKLIESTVSTSAKKPLTSSGAIVELSALVWLGTVPLAVGASLVPVIVTVTVAESVADPSLIV